MNILLYFKLGIALSHLYKLLYFLKLNFNNFFFQISFYNMILKYDFYSLLLKTLRIFFINIQKFYNGIYSLKLFVYQKASKIYPT